MKILGIDCSAGPVSAAVSESGRILSQSFANIKLTHSETLLPMVTEALRNSRIELSEIDCIAVSSGPGSFTGIRIGISAVKGLAAARSLLCVGVSTLRAIAEGFRGTHCIVCAVMDARCNQVYNALFEIKGQTLTRLCPDRAILSAELAEELTRYAVNSAIPVLIAGDGTDIFLPFTEHIPNIVAASELQRYQTAAGVCLAGEELFSAGEAVSPSALSPLYLRLPQAERELKKKQNEEK